jgi:hypothetical protein
LSGPGRGASVAATKRPLDDAVDVRRSRDDRTGRDRERPGAGVLGLRRERRRPDRRAVHRIGPFEGREAIRKLHADSLAAQTDQRRHNLSNVVLVKESPDTATTTSNLTLLSIENGAVRVLSSGWYRDDLVKSGGEWLIATRHIYLDLPY